ncbi:MAG: glycosylasparaginase [Acidobacteria bacterium]|nr:glycosylasparaginase [Acidobacteriota bacterium]
MSGDGGNEGIRRREFIRRSAAGLSVPVLAGELTVSGAQGGTRPLVISSSNRNRTPTGEVFEGGIACVTRAMEIIRGGGDTLDAVVAGVKIVEDDPRDDSVGYGGLPNEECEVELDASVMHGPSRRAGAVASLRYIKNPASVAKLVLERTDHLLLVGEGALRFALKHGFKKEDLLTEPSRLAWLAWRESLNPRDGWGPSPLRTAGEQAKKTSSAGTSGLSREEIALNEWIAEKLRHRQTGTINCLAINAGGDISGVTTTSGLAWKIPGRVGDSPIIGSGLYVDNEVGAAGSTGRGEECIYINGSHTIVENMRRGMSPTDAAMDAIKRISHRYGDNLTELAKFSINFYAINKRGEHGGASLWKGGTYAIHDGREARIVDSAWLYERK